MDQIEQEFGLETHPILWPIGDGERWEYSCGFVFYLLVKPKVHLMHIRLRTNHDSNLHNNA
jgi:peptide subunit release factor RF-3